ncbi:hypothetical protein [Tropicimonas sp.]|uniref:hypothetical protein n=1 Tax=Tropicimonas sp. TaxID=2067044 RepID=UPI003A879983
MTDAMTNIADVAMEQMLATIGDFQKTANAMTGWTQPDYMVAVTRMNTEFADFVATRIRENLKTQTEAAQSRSAMELGEIQYRFFTTAVEQYFGEVGRQARLSQFALEEWTERKGTG